MRVRLLLLTVAMLTAGYGQNRNSVDIPAGCTLSLAADDLNAANGSRVSVWPGRCGEASARSDSKDRSPAFRAKMINGGIPDCPITPVGTYACRAAKTYCAHPPDVQGADVQGG